LLILFLYIFTYIYICVYVYVYVHSYICIYCMYINIHIYVYMYIYKCMYIYKNICRCWISCCHQRSFERYGDICIRVHMRILIWIKDDSHRVWWFILDWIDSFLSSFGIDIDIDDEGQYLQNNINIWRWSEWIYPICTGDIILRDSSVTKLYICIYTYIHTYTYILLLLQYI
jgi:hypothetical protein